MLSASLYMPYNEEFGGAREMSRLGMGMEFRIEKKELVGHVGFGKFRKIDIDSIAFPMAEELNLIARHTGVCGSDCSAFVKGVTRESPSGDT